MRRRRWSYLVAAVIAVASAAAAAQSAQRGSACATPESIDAELSRIRDANRATFLRVAARQGIEASTVGQRPAIERVISDLAGRVSFAAPGAIASAGAITTVAGAPHPHDEPDADLFGRDTRGAWHLLILEVEAGPTRRRVACGCGPLCADRSVTSWWMRPTVCPGGAARIPGGRQNLYRLAPRDSAGPPITVRAPLVTALVEGSERCAPPP